MPPPPSVFPPSEPPELFSFQIALYSDPSTIVSHPLNSKPDFSGVGTVPSVQTYVSLPSANCPPFALYVIFFFDFSIAIETPVAYVCSPEESLVETLVTLSTLAASVYVIENDGAYARF